MYPHLSHDLAFSCHHILSTFQLLLPHTLQIVYRGCALKIRQGSSIYKMSIEKENMSTHIPRTLKSPLMHLLQKCLHILHSSSSFTTILLHTNYLTRITSFFISYKFPHISIPNTKRQHHLHTHQKKTFNLQSRPLLKVSSHFPSKSFQ